MVYTSPISTAVQKWLFDNQCYWPEGNICQSQAVPYLYVSDKVIIWDNEGDLFHSTNVPLVTPLFIGLLQHSSKMTVVNFNVDNLPNL